MPSLENKKRSSRLTFLKEVGRDGAADEFQRLLIQYRNDQESREALEIGLDDTLKTISISDSLDWSYQDAGKKRDILKDFYLDRGAFANLPPIETAAANTNKETSLKDVFAALQKIEKRLDVLEQKPRGKARKPSL